MSPDRRAFRHDHRSLRAGLYVLLLATSLAAAASDPRPDHGSTFIDPNVVLLWSGPENPPAVVLGYRVYLSTSQSAVEQAQISAFVDSTVPDVSACPIGALAFDTTYYWRIDAFLATGDTLPGDVWFFTTEPLDIPGVVVHHSPASSGIYLGSPAVVALADGAYLAKCDEFGPGSTYNKTLLFRSSDSGRTWHSLSSVQPMFWATPFVHNGALYLFGVTGRSPASTILCRSDDSGESWTSPGDSHSGLLFSYSISNAPAVHIVHNGRIWFAMSDGGGNSTTGAWCSANRMFLLSAPADSDLLEATNWSLSPKLDFDEANWIYPWFNQSFGGWLEANVVLAPDGHLISMARVDTLHYPDVVQEKAAYIDFGLDGNTITFHPDEDFIDFPGGCKKFAIRYDPPSGRYWALSNPVLPQHADYNVERARNALALLSSADLRHWTIETILLYHPSITDHGFQYPFFQFDGDDLIAAVRTAYDDGLGGADNQHNANFLTFHRFENFRGPWPPAFDREPAEQAVPSGDTACFSVEAHNGTLSFQWYRQTPDQPDEQLTDNSRISGAVTSQLCIADVSPEDEGLYYCVATNEIDSTPSSLAALVVGKLRAHYPFEGDFADTANDYNAVAVVAAPGFTSDAILDSYAATFNGVDQSLQIPQLIADSFTIALWVRTTQTASTGQWWAGAGLVDGEVSGAAADFGTALVGSCFALGLGDPDTTICSTTPVNDGQWHHLAATRSVSSGKICVYVDGVLEVSGFAATSSRASPTVLRIGAIATDQNFFRGDLDDIRLYNYALSSLELASLYTSGSGRRLCYSRPAWDLTTDPGASSFCRVDLRDLALFATQWLACGLVPDCLP